MRPVRLGLRWRLLYRSWAQPLRLVVWSYASWSCWSVAKILSHAFIGLSSDLDFASAASQLACRPLYSNCDALQLSQKELERVLWWRVRQKILRCWTEQASLAWFGGLPGPSVSAKHPESDLKGSLSRQRGLALWDEATGRCWTSPSRDWLGGATAFSVLANPRQWQLDS